MSLFITLKRVDDDEVCSTLSTQITSILVRFPVTPLMLSRVDISGKNAEVAKLNTMEPLVFAPGLKCQQVGYMSPPLFHFQA